MSAEAPPIFIVGAPRSGTSALAWALAEHPALWTSAESDWMGILLGGDRLSRAYARSTERGPRQWLSKQAVSFEDWTAAIGHGIDRLHREQSGGRGWIDQTPSYVHHVDALAAMFPTAHFLHLVRNGREVVHSLLHSGFDIELAKSFDRACRGWADHVKAGCEAEARHPARILRVRHDRLRADPEAVCDEIFGFVGLGRAPAAAAFLRAHRVNSSFEGSSRTATADRDASWSRWQRFRFRRIAGHSMSELGFD